LASVAPQVPTSHKLRPCPHAAVERATAAPHVYVKRTSGAMSTPDTGGHSSSRRDASKAMKQYVLVVPERQSTWLRRKNLPLQPFSQKSRTPTVAKECQIGLYDPAEADLELFRNSWSAGFLGERLYDPAQADFKTQCGSTWPEMAFVSHPQLTSSTAQLGRRTDLSVAPAPSGPSQPRASIGPLIGTGCNL